MPNKILDDFGEDKIRNSFLQSSIFLVLGIIISGLSVFLLNINLNIIIPIILSLISTLLGISGYRESINGNIKSKFQKAFIAAGNIFLILFSLFLLCMYYWVEFMFFD